MTLFFVLHVFEDYTFSSAVSVARRRISLSGDGALVGRLVLFGREEAPNLRERGETYMIDSI